MVQDPGRLGLASAPNVTGVAASIPIKNQLAAFRMVYPSGPRVGVLYNPDNVGRQVQEAKRVAPVVHLIIVDRGIGSEREVPEALRALLKGDSAVDALGFPPDPMLLAEDSRRYILSEALK